MRLKTVWGLMFLAALVSVGTGQVIGPKVISPGSESGVAVVERRCPTFSWSAVSWAAGYRVAVFEAVSSEVRSYEEMAVAVTPILIKEIAGQALSWTPSVREGLGNGGLYVWYVQATDVNGQGVWSSGKVFEVDVERGFAAGLAERTDKRVKQVGGVEDTGANAVAEARSEMIAKAAASEFTLPGVGRPSGTVGIQGFEGDVNTFYGLNAGYVIRYEGGTGTLNTFIGRAAGYYNTSGHENTFLGHLAGHHNTEGYQNIFIGIGAGFKNAGHQNTFIGQEAGYYNEDDCNTFIGYEAGRANTFGFSNTFLGRSAGYSNTTGYYNTFLGRCAGHHNTQGVENTFLGSEAGVSNTTGCSNTFLGRNAGFSNTTGSLNTFLGDYAGYWNTTGNYNVFLGNRAGYNETGSNKLYIANSDTGTPLIWGDFSTAIVGINGTLGVGTKTPGFPVHVQRTGTNSSIILDRTDGAKNYVNATATAGNFGTANNFPLRFMVNGVWKMQLLSDNSLSMTNGATCTTGGVWTNASSRALKENIEGLTAEEAAAAFEALSPVTYNYKADKAERHVGFIAEDVPELVATKDRKSLSPMDVVAVLTKVVQEQQKTISEYQKNLAEQKGMIADQQKTLSAYQKSLLEQQKTNAELYERIAELEKKRPAER